MSAENPYLRKLRSTYGADHAVRTPTPHQQQELLDRQKRLGALSEETGLSIYVLETVFYPNGTYQVHKEEVLKASVAHMIDTYGTDVWDILDASCFDTDGSIKEGKLRHKLKSHRNGNGSHG